MCLTCRVMSMRTRLAAGRCIVLPSHLDSPSSGARTLGTHIMFERWFGKKKQFFN